jgi:hypothetical protein
MKRDKKTTFALKSGFAFAGMAVSYPLVAHFDGTAHEPVTGPAHGLVHALMDSPVMATAAVAVITALWMLLRLRKARAGRLLSGDSPELKQE